MYMSRLHRQGRPARTRMLRRSPVAWLGSNMPPRPPVPTSDRSNTGPRQLIAAVDALTAAVIDATGSGAFLASERIQLIDAAYKLAWLLVRMNRREAMVARQPHLPCTLQATLTAAHAVLAVRRLGDGAMVVAELSDLILRIDQLLPRSAQLYQ